MEDTIGLVFARNGAQAPALIYSRSAASFFLKLQMSRLTLAGVSVGVSRPPIPALTSSLSAHCRKTHAAPPVVMSA